jgi:hypothetical protein
MPRNNKVLSPVDKAFLQIRKAEKQMVTAKQNLRKAHFEERQRKEERCAICVANQAPPPAYPISIAYPAEEKQKPLTQKSEQFLQEREFFLTSRQNVQEVRRHNEERDRQITKSESRLALVKNQEAPWVVHGQPAGYDDSDDDVQTPAQYLKDYNTMISNQAVRDPARVEPPNIVPFTSVAPVRRRKPPHVRAQRYPFERRNDFVFRDRAYDYFNDSNDNSDGNDVYYPHGSEGERE